MLSASGMWFEKERNLDTLCLCMKFTEKGMASFLSGEHHLAGGVRKYFIALG